MVFLITDHCRLYNVPSLKAYENIVVFTKVHLYSEIIQRLQRSEVCPSSKTDMRLQITDMRLQIANRLLLLSWPNSIFLFGPMPFDVSF